MVAVTVVVKGLREYQGATGRNNQSVKAGDIVLIHNDICKTKWKMAIVE